MTAHKKSSASSSDRAFYEAIKRKNPRASSFWLTGNNLYHAGLTLVMLLLPCIFFAYTKEASVTLMAWLAAGLVASFVMLFGGIFLKRESYKIAMKDGMDITKYL